GRLWVRHGVPVQLPPAPGGSPGARQELDGDPRPGNARRPGAGGTYPNGFMKKKIAFLKMSGSGNDFVLVDNRRGQFPKPVSAWAKKLCHRQEGVGADGLLLLEKSRTADFRMVYFNADGSRASMCGNGARCIAWFAQDQRAARPQSRFETDAGLVEAR